MLRSALIGAGAGILIFLGFRGVDIWPIVFLLAVGALLAQTGLLGRLGSVARRSRVSVPTVGFEDIGGQASAKGELKEALEILLRPEAFSTLGIRPLKGILLTGPPGTGKTLLAKAAAQYTASTFLSASGSEFVEMYAGVGASRVRTLFQEARSLARREGRGSAIIFIDELEVMAGRRGQHHSHLEYDQTLNQLLVEMDGIAEHEGVRILVMAATNRADLLDPALLRPGRFDRVVRVDLPDREARRHILALHSRNKPLAQDVDLDAVARETFGFSGAHLESVVNEAALTALREGSDTVGMAHLRSAIDKVMLGERLNRQLRREEMRRVAVHEGGHALVSEWINPGSVSSVTIAPRGMALGFVRHAPEDDRLMETEAELRADIAVAIAGAVAERRLLGQASTGATSDFDRAWEVGRRMVAAGLSDLGVVQEDALPADLLVKTIQGLIDREWTRVEAFLATEGERLDLVARRLEVDETLDGETLRRVLAARTDEVTA